MIEPWLKKVEKETLRAISPQLEVAKVWWNVIALVVEFDSGTSMPSTVTRRLGGTMTAC